jgi:hypothetical protein
MMKPNNNPDKPVTEHPFIYKLVVRLQRFIRRIRHNLTTAEIELNFMRYKLLFGERDDDIYIVTFPKSGTTLMQMLLYQLTTNGNMNFKHIYDVSPWIRNDAYRGISPRELTSPRLIKSHDGYQKFDRDTRGHFIYVYRNPMDVAISLYHQRRNYGLPKLEFEKFLKSFLKEGKMNWFTFNQKWFENKYNFPILYIQYEDLLDNFKACLEKVSNFLQIAYSGEDLIRIEEHCSFDFMKNHEEKFGVQPVEKPPMVYDQFIRKGKAGEGIEMLTEEHKSLFRQRYNELVYPYESKKTEKPLRAYF